MNVNMQGNMNGIAIRLTPGGAAGGLPARGTVEQHTPIKRVIGERGG
jgi:hypothetical protein